MTGAAPSFPASSMPDRDWWSALWPDPEAALVRLGINRSMTVFDLCCGDGYFTAPLARLVGGKVTALDIDETMLERARLEVAQRGVSVRRWLCEDARRIGELLSEKVDYVLMANTFHGVPDQTALARAVRQVLLPDGRFGIVNWHPRPREDTPVLGVARGPKSEMRMAWQTVVDCVEPTGFDLSALTELPPYHYGIVFRAVSRPPSPAPIGSLGALKRQGVTNSLCRLLQDAKRDVGIIWT